jgi:hypothetical protein|tara:strand:+ start:57 stop:227 length:171 start_codon:yes stop_codon:yes gene_type:complete
MKDKITGNYTPKENHLEVNLNGKKYTIKNANDFFKGNLADKLKELEENDLKNQNKQ